MTIPSPRPSAATWTPQQLGDFVGHVRDDRFFALWMLVATTGIQIDTLLDLRREDVDIQEPRLNPRRTSFTNRGSVPLGVTKSYALDPDTLDALRNHVIAWDKEQIGEDLRCKRLFAWADGEPLHPRSVEVLFRRHCLKAGLPVVRLQAVRQAYVVAAIETGIPTAVISERLGRTVTPSTMLEIPRVDPAERRARSTEATSPSRRTKDSDRRRSCHLRSC